MCCHCPGNSPMRSAPDSVGSCGCWENDCIFSTWYHISPFFFKGGKIKPRSRRSPPPSYHSSHARAKFPSSTGKEGLGHNNLRNKFTPAKIVLPTDSRSDTDRTKSRRSPISPQGEAREDASATLFDLPLVAKENCNYI